VNKKEIESFRKSIGKELYSLSFLSASIKDDVAGRQYARIGNEIGTGEYRLLT